jgi:hypothetical protein
MGALAMMNLQGGNENDVETYVYVAKDCNDTDTGESMPSQPDWPVPQWPGDGNALPKGNSKCTIYCPRV